MHPSMMTIEIMVITFISTDIEAYVRISFVNEPEFPAMSVKYWIGIYEVAENRYLESET